MQSETFERDDLPQEGSGKPEMKDVTLKEGAPFLGDPQYQEFMEAFQKGEWAVCAELIGELTERYPGEAELEAFRQTVAIKSSLALQAGEQEKADEKALRIRIGLAAVGVVALALLAFFGYSSFSENLRQRWQAASQQIASQFENLDLSVKFRDAQNLLIAGRPNEALAILEEIEAVDPDYPELGEALDEANKLILLETQYEQAATQEEENDLSGALETFTAIYEIEPNYRDVKIRIDDLKRNIQVDEFLAKANDSYDQEMWLDAIQNFEAALDLDPTLMNEIEDQLFESYTYGAEQLLRNEDASLEDIETAEAYYRKSISLHPQEREVLERRADFQETIADLLVENYFKIAQSILIENADSLEALDSALEYLGRALLLRPESPEIQIQYNLAKRYLSAVDNFRASLWTDAIDDLEYIYSIDPDYAEGTARQLLYEGYVKKGNNWLVGGDFDEALSEFQKAALVAQDEPESALRLYEAQIKVAYTMGRLNMYRDAVNLYQAAVETAGILESTEEENQDLILKIRDADNAAFSGNFQRAWILYNDALNGENKIFVILVHVVEKGDYLAQLAREYGSTIEAIMEANNLTNPNYIYVGQQLLIPVLKK